MVNEAIEELFLEAIANGSSVAMAQKAIGVGPNWSSDRCRNMAGWKEKVDVWSAKAYQDAVRNLKEAGIKDWRASESYLKRRHREEWGDHTAIDLDMSPVASRILGLRSKTDEQKAIE